MIPVLGRKQARGVRSIKWAQKAKKHLKTTGIMSKDSGANPLGHLLAKDGISEHQKKKKTTEATSRNEDPVLLQ